MFYIYKKKMPERVQQKEIYKLYNKKKKKTKQTVHLQLLS